MAAAPSAASKAAISSLRLAGHKALRLAEIPAGGRKPFSAQNTDSAQISSGLWLSSR